MFVPGLQMGIKYYDADHGGITVIRGLFVCMTETHVYIAQPHEDGHNIVAKPHSAYEEIYQMVKHDPK